MRILRRQKANFALDAQGILCYIISASRSGEAFQCAQAQPRDPGEYLKEVLQFMYAIIAAGGKQYRVSQGDVIYIDKVNQEADSKISFDVLMIGGEGDVKVGDPILKGAKVEGKILAQVKGEKITVFKYRSKKDSKRKIGHRQPYTKVEITTVKA